MKISAKITRAPKHMGTGIWVNKQFTPEQLVKGDTFMDADLGDMVWDGRKWISVDDWDKIHWEKIHKQYRKKLLSRKTLLPFYKWLARHFHHPKRNGIK